jgi:hypothetical protein
MSSMPCRIASRPWSDPPDANPSTLIGASRPLQSHSTSPKQTSCSPGDHVARSTPINHVHCHHKAITHSMSLPSESCSHYRVIFLLGRPDPHQLLTLRAVPPNVAWPATVPALDPARCRTTTTPVHMPSKEGYSSFPAVFSVLLQLPAW